MKILYLITKAERGGAQSHVWELMRLQRFGTPMLAVGEEGFLADRARAAGFPVFLIPHLVHPITPLKDLLATREVMDLIRSERPDLIHAHTAKAGMLARLAGFLTGTPTVYTVHAWSFTAMRSPVMRTLSLWIERALSIMDQMVIEVSHFNFTMAEREAVAPRGNHLIIWNGVADSPHQATFPADTSIDQLQNPIEIIMVARFASPKRQDLLLAALSQLSDTWRCSFVGSGPSENQVKDQAIALGMQDRVRFLGDRDDVPELLAKSHLFVLCSDSESLPISILEAMRAGLPAIASAVGGCAELVEEGVTGFLVKPGDVSSVRSSISRMIEDRNLLRAMGRAGRVRFQTDFRIEGMVRQTVAAYSRLVPSPGIAFQP